MKTTRYFEVARMRRGKEQIEDAWIEQAIRTPEREERQSDGRLRRWARIDVAGGRYLRAVLLADGETVRNAFFDRNFSP